MLEAALAELDHLAIVRTDKTCRAKQVGLTQSALRHLRRVIGKTKMRPDKIELPLPARHDVARAQRIDLLLDDETGEQRDHGHGWCDVTAGDGRVGHLPPGLRHHIQQAVVVQRHVGLEGSDALRHRGLPALVAARNHHRVAAMRVHHHAALLIGAP